ncbi:MAG: hypothetical protein PHU80_09250, partial [Kiritimatiellae bacterium]|nr:hypothetical protein [Kiritimatiellia bacterium]
MSKTAQHAATPTKQTKSLLRQTLIVFSAVAIYRNLFFGQRLYKLLIIEAVHRRAQPLVGNFSVRASLPKPKIRIPFTQTTILAALEQADFFQR